MSLITRTTGTSAADAAQTVSTPTGAARQVLFYTVKYSAAPTQAGATGTLNSGAGAAFDAVLNTGTANAQTTVFFPSGTLILAPDDALDVTAPAGGGGITSSIAIYTRPA